MRMTNAMTCASHTLFLSQCRCDTEMCACRCEKKVTCDVCCSHLSPSVAFSCKRSDYNKKCQIVTLSISMRKRLQQVALFCDAARKFSIVRMSVSPRRFRKKQSSRHIGAAVEEWVTRECGQSGAFTAIQSTHQSRNGRCGALCFMT